MFAFILPYFVFALAFSKKLNMRDLGKFGDFSYGFYLYAFPMQQLIAYLFPSELSPLSMIVLSTAGTLPLCLWDYVSQLKKGDNIILAAFGGGFTWGSIYLKWAYDKK